MSGLSEMFKQFLGAFHEILRSNSQDNRKLSVRSCICVNEQNCKHSRKFYDASGRTIGHHIRVQIKTRDKMFMFKFFVINFVIILF